MTLATSDRCRLLPPVALCPTALHATALYFAACIPDISSRLIPDTSSRLAKCRPIPSDAKSTVARRTSLVRVDIADIPCDDGKFKQIKLTIQRTSPIIE